MENSFYRRLAKVILVLAILSFIGITLLFGTRNFASAEDEIPEETYTSSVNELPIITPEPVVLPENPFFDETYLGLLMHDVWEIQNRLNNLGYHVDLDGKYEMATDSAVRMFQKKSGLTPDGICGIKTQTALGILGELENVGIDYLFAPLAGTGTDTRVTLSRSFSKTTVYVWTEEGWKVMLESESMCGAPGKETPVGNYKIINADEKGFSKNGKYYRYMMTFYVPGGDWARAYGFHTVAMNANGEALQSVATEEYRHVTSGCIRNDVENAKWIFENVPVGTDVRIY